MNWILVTLFLNAQTGDLVRFTERPSTLAECIAPATPVLTTDGLAQMTICKRVDKDGKAITQLDSNAPKVQS